MVKRHGWVQEFPGAITVCDSAGTILELNSSAVAVFRTQGGKKLIGTNLADCHPAPALRKLKRVMNHRQTNVYTVLKKGAKKIILQVPWYEEKKYRGFVEISLPIKGKIPNITRKT
jgi:sensor histidine kinase regulating citrate/malate metabolism